MEEVISNNRLRLLKMVVFIITIILFDLLNRGLIKSIVFAILLALLILEVYNEN